MKEKDPHNSQEFQPRQVTPEEYEKLCELYDEVSAAGYFANEFLWPNSYGAVVGRQKDLAEALGLDSIDGLTSEDFDALPSYLPFALPGAGPTRLDAVKQAFEAAKKHFENEAVVEKSEAFDGEEYGRFTVGGATLVAYLPNHKPDCWAVTIDRPGQLHVTEYLAMHYVPVYGPDANDVRNLNGFIKKLIKKYGLE